MKYRHSTPPTYADRQKDSSQHPPQKAHRNTCKSIRGIVPNGRNNSLHALMGVRSLQFPMAETTRSRDGDHFSFQWQKQLAPCAHGGAITLHQRRLYSHRNPCGGGKHRSLLASCVCFLKKATPETIRQSLQQALIHFFGYRCQSTPPHIIYISPEPPPSNRYTHMRTNFE